MTPDEDGLRSALLQRLIDDVAVVAEYERRMDLPLARCCYVEYEVVEHGRKVVRAHRLCGDKRILGWFTPPCDHAHHRSEVWLA